MQLEFFKTRPPFTEAILYRQIGDLTWHNLQEMPENSQRIIVCKLQDNYMSAGKVSDARRKGATTNLQILERVIPQVWGKLNQELDIDEDTLNFEIS